MSSIIVCEILLFILLFISRIKRDNVGGYLGLSMVGLTFVFVLFAYVFVYKRLPLAISDSLNYRDIYYFGDVDLQIEVGYLFLCGFFRNMGLPFEAFLCFINALCFCLLGYIYVKCFGWRDVLIPYIVLISFFGSWNYGIIIRASIASTFILLAVYYLYCCRQTVSLKNLLLYYVIIVCAFFIHRSAFVFFLVPVFVNIDFKSGYLYLLLIVAFILPNIPILNDMVYSLVTTFGSIVGTDKFDIYSNLAHNNGLRSISLMSYILFGALFVYMKGHLNLSAYQYRFYNVMVNLYVVGVVLVGLFSSIPAGERLSYLFLTFDSLLMSYCFIYSNANVLFKYMCLFVVVAVNLFSLFRKVPELLSY